MKARKMREGTWMERKPPRKTPSPQDKGAEESVAGVKRPHSDSSISSSDKQQLKRPRSIKVQAGTFKEAVSGIKMAIIHGRHTELKLNQTQVDMIQNKLLNAVDGTFSEETSPQFLYSKFTQGIFWITCANGHSKVWLTRTISEFGEIWEGAELKAVDFKDLQKDPGCSSAFPIPLTVMTRLKIQNRELNTTEWSVMC
jgi:hypothetical protein